MKIGKWLVKQLHLSCGFSNRICTEPNAPIASPGPKTPRLQGSFPTKISLIIPHNAKAEIKPSLSVTKQSLIVISAAFVLLPLPLKPLTWREVLPLHHNSSVMGQDLTRHFASSKVSMLSQDSQGLWNEYKKVSWVLDTRIWKWWETPLPMDGHRLAFGMRAHRENQKPEPGWEAAEPDRIVPSG